MRPLLARIEVLIEALTHPNNIDELNNVKMVLAHKDLHFANIMYDTKTSQITSILDWEFAGIVPFTRWNPIKAFPWNAQHSPSSDQEWKRLWNMFVKRCQEQGVSILKDQEFSGPKQEAMQKAANFLRAIVEVCPRGEKLELAQGIWKDTFLEQVSAFDL